MKKEDVFSVVLLPGDGIGPEVTRSAVRVLEAAMSETGGFRLDFHELSVGAGEFLKNGDPLPRAALAACAAADGVLLGAMGLPSVRWPDGRELTPQIDLREQLDLYGGLRPVYLYHEQDTPLKGIKAGGIDLLLVRENTEGLFAARHDSRTSDDCVTDTMKITRKGAERICRLAFDEAMKRRKYVTLIDKANVLPSMVYLREIFDEVAKDYPEVRTDRYYVDAMSLYLVQDPCRFDVMVTENMFGDIISDLIAGLVGGMGFAPSGDLGQDCAVFQPSHGTAPDIAGQGIANPVATILSAAMMLDWFDTPSTKAAATSINNSVKEVLSNPAVRTRELGGTCSTDEITDRIIQCLSNHS